MNMHTQYTWWNWSDLNIQIAGLPLPPMSGSHGPTRHYVVKRNWHVNGEKMNIW